MMMNIKTLTRYLLQATIVLGSLAACTKEDLSSCVPATVLNFHYAYPKLETNNEFPNPVKVVRLFVFDERTQYFVREVIQSVPEESVYDSFSLSVDLLPGQYSIIAWAGEVHPDLVTATSEGNVMLPAAPVPGKTTLEQVALVLQNAAATRSDIVKNNTMINQYNGVVKQVEVMPQKEQRYNVALSLSVHNVLVILNDVRTPNPDASALKVSASLPNHALTFENEVHPMAQQVLYTPFLTNDLTPISREATLSVLRMQPDMEGDLVVTDSRTGTELFRKSLISEILARHPNVSSNPSVNLEKYSKYEIELDITDSKVIISITVDNWKVRLVDTDM